MTEDCTYCGEPADSRDHLWPRAWTGDHQGGKKGRTGPWVWACRDCNTRLGAVAFHTVDERRAYVQAALTRKHRNLLSGYQWPTPERLSELGPNLRRVAITRCMAYISGSSRIVWPEIPEWARDLERLEQIRQWVNFRFDEVAS